jgi:hypothetical protein
MTIDYVVHIDQSFQRVQEIWRKCFAFSIGHSGRILSPNRKDLSIKTCGDKIKKSSPVRVSFLMKLFRLDTQTESSRRSPVP